MLIKLTFILTNNIQFAYNPQLFLLKSSSNHLPPQPQQPFPTNHQHLHSLIITSSTPNQSIPPTITSNLLILHPSIDFTHAPPTITGLCPRPSLTLKLSLFSSCSLPTFSVRPLNDYSRKNYRNLVLELNVPMMFNR